MATRAITVPEQNGIPSVINVCKTFDTQATATAAGLGTFGLPAAVFEKHVDTYTVPELNEQVRTAIADQVVKALTQQPPEGKLPQEPKPTDIMFKGTYEEVNKFYIENQWSEGLPIVPPTVEKVKEFLKFTNRSPDEVIGVLLPDSREITVWNVAVNGVMAGCRPEYMPILIAIAEVLADPGYGVRHLGNTPGTEQQIYLNGPIIKQLGFNYEQGALRPGFQPNISIGRAYRLLVRNVAGFLPRTTDKGTFGGTFRGVLAENEDFVAKIGWKPLSVDQGFKAGDNVVTMNSCVSNDSVYSMATDEAETTLDRIAARLIDIGIFYTGQSRDAGKLPMTHQLLMGPTIAEHLASHGYTKEAVKQYLWKHSFFPAKRFNLLNGDLAKGQDGLCNGVKNGALPASYCESRDPERMVPLYPNPEALVLVVSGDPARDNLYFCTQNGQHGYLTSEKVVLPADWEKLLSEAKAK